MVTKRWIQKELEEVEKMLKKKMYARERNAWRKYKQNLLEFELQIKQGKVTDNKVYDDKEGEK